MKNIAWKDRAVLITGGAGFIGSWLAHDLLVQHARVFILDIKPALPSLGEAADSLLANAKFIQGDIRDTMLIKKLLKKYSIKTIFHLAAKSLIQDVLENPSEGLDTNIKGTWNILEVVRKVCDKNCHILVASSDKAYGTHRKLPYKESHPLQGENPYDCSKSCADLIAQMYAKSYGLPICIVRCGNVFGGGDLNFSRLIPDAIRCFLYDRPIILRSDGTYKRDYIYIHDVTAAYIRTAETMRNRNFRNDIFNFGNNQPMTVLKIIKAIARSMRKTYIKPVICNTAIHEIKDQYLDSSKAIRQLRWKPRYTFEEGIKKTIAWYTNYFNTRNAT